MSRHPENQPDRIRQFTVDRSSCFPSVSQWSDGNIRKAWPVTKVAASREDRVRPGASPASLSASQSCGERSSCSSTGTGGSSASWVRCFPPIPPGLDCWMRSTSASGIHLWRAMDGAGSRCKIVVVGDTQCGKTALLHVFAKDCYPEVSLSKVRVSV